MGSHSFSAACLLDSNLMVFNMLFSDLIPSDVQDSSNRGVVEAHDSSEIILREVPCLAAPYVVLVAR